jgi:hypothetical protein
MECVPKRSPCESTLNMHRALFVAALSLSCVHAAEQPLGYPLYPNSGTRMPRDRVAELATVMPGGSSVGAGSAAFIHAVDGRDVSTLDTAFELTPGCHVVQTESRLLIANEAITWRGELGPRLFPFQMKPGNTYLVKVDLVQGMGASARVLVYGIEQDAAGRDVQRIEPAKNAADLRACMAATAPTSTAPAPATR